MEIEQLENKETNRRDIQDYLSLGYIYLVVVGILFDAIFYGILGINIIHYSSVLDVLLSPVAFFTDSIIIPLMVGGMILFLFGIGKWSRYYHDKHKEKEWYKNKYDVGDLEKKYAKGDSLEGMLTGFGIFFLTMFVTYTTLRGNSLKNKIAKKEIKLNKRITFQNDSIVEVKFIGMNSQYVFYLLENDSIITASPIQGTIKGIRDLEMDKK